MSALVSCIVPVWNGERYLNAALDSIFAQRYTTIEVIVVDDGSTDGTASLAATYGDRLRYLYQANSGPPTARNHGLRAAAGEFIAFLDADDLWHPDKIALQMACFDRDPLLDYCVARVRNFWEDEVRDETAVLKDHPRSGAMPGYVTGTLLVKRRVIDMVGGFNEQFAHGDAAEWFLRARDAGTRGELLQDVLLFRRMHRDNRSRLRAGGSQQEFLNLVKATLDRRRAAGR